MTHAPSSPQDRSLLLPWLTALVWAAAMASTVFWGMRLMPSEPASVSVVNSAAGASPRVQAVTVARALGQAVSTQGSSAVTVASRFQLRGTVADASGAGSALIATDGKAPRTYLVGQTVADDWVLVSLSAKQAQLQSPVATMTLDLALPAKP